MKSRPGGANWVPRLTPCLPAVPAVDELWEVSMQELCYAWVVCGKDAYWQKVHSFVEFRDKSPRVPALPIFCLEG